MRWKLTLLIVYFQAQRCQQQNFQPRTAAIHWQMPWLAVHVFCLIRGCRTHVNLVHYYLPFLHLISLFFFCNCFWLHFPFSEVPVMECFFFLISWSEVAVRVNLVHSNFSFFALFSHYSLFFICFWFHFPYLEVAVMVHLLYIIQKSNKRTLNLFLKLTLISKFGKNRLWAKQHILTSENVSRIGTATTLSFWKWKRGLATAQWSTMGALHRLTTTAEANKL